MLRNVAAMQTNTASSIDAAQRRPFAWCAWSSRRASTGWDGDA